MADCDETWKNSGGSHHPRPKKVEPCSECGEARGTNYPDCPSCYQAIEDIWLADWRALLEREGVQAGSEDEALLAQVVIAEFGCHPWTVVDMAMTLIRCETCGHELGSRYTECGECGMAFGGSILAEFGASFNDHALHVGRFVLRHKHQHSANAVAAWTLTTPRVLTGWLPSTGEAQRMMAEVKAGKIEQVKASLADLDREINADS